MVVGLDSLDLHQPPEVPRHLRVSLSIGRLDRRPEVNRGPPDTFFFCACFFVVGNFTNDNFTILPTEDKQTEQTETKTHKTDR